MSEFDIPGNRVKPTFVDYEAARDLLEHGGSLVDLMAEAVARERLAREELAEARQDAIDERTGLPLPAVATRRANEILGRIADHRRSIDPVSAIAFMSDIVEFKAINRAKTYEGGHAYIKATADFLNEVVRDTDVLTRWGGDEFVILSPVFPGLTEDEVVSIIEGRLTNVPQSELFPSQIRWDFTTYLPGDNLATMLNRIDITTDNGKDAAKYSDINKLFQL